MHSTQTKVPNESKKSELNAITDQLKRHELQLIIQLKLEMKNNRRTHSRVRLESFICSPLYSTLMFSKAGQMSKPSPHTCYQKTHYI